MGNTKKVGLTGKYGSRYGRTTRQTVRALVEAQKAKHRCVQCLSFSVKRKSAGIWACTKCGHTFAGKAYKPS